MEKIISFIIPCYGSERTVPIVIEEIKKTVGHVKNFDYEIIAVNDKSPDNVWETLCKIAQNDNKVKLINLAKNMNRPGALMAGMSEVTGDYVVLMDDDGQCPMDRLWDLVIELENGHDIAIAKYPEKKQSKFKNFGSYVNRKMTEFIIDKPKDLMFTNFAILKKYIVDEIKKYNNPYPYITGLMLRTTSDIVNVEMEERERISGSTNFTFIKMLSLWINGFTAFSVKPLRLATLMGLATSCFGFLYGLIIVFQKIFNPAVMHGYSSIMAAILFIGGILMLMLGLIGEYIGRIYISINNSPQFVIREKINCDEEGKNKKNEE